MHPQSIYSIIAATIAINAAAGPATIFAAAPVNSAGIDDDGKPPVATAVDVAVPLYMDDPVDDGYGFTPSPGANWAKFAQPMRVLLARCTTKERLPKKAGSSARVER